MNWIKIMCNILDHRKIKMIRKGPEGNTLVLLWLLILTEAGKCGRGGYLMVSDSLPYTAETLSMVTDIPLPTVQLGLRIFAELEMLDRRDEAIFIRNWAKYQSEDRLEARREKDRLRQQRHREKERNKIQALIAAPTRVSHDSHVSLSCDVTAKKRTERNRAEKPTTDTIRMMLSGTCLEQVSMRELQGLAKRHGNERLLSAADIAVQTWQRKGSPEALQNPGGYLHSLCVSLIVPEWYVPFPERMAHQAEIHEQKQKIEAERAALAAKEEAKIAARDAWWDSLSAEQRDGYIAQALADLPSGIKPSATVSTIMAKSLAWTQRKEEPTNDHSSQGNPGQHSVD